MKIDEGSLDLVSLLTLKKQVLAAILKKVEIQLTEIPPRTEVMVRHETGLTRYDHRQDEKTSLAKATGEKFVKLSKMKEFLISVPTRISGSNTVTLGNIAVINVDEIPQIIVLVPDFFVETGVYKIVGHQVHVKTSESLIVRELLARGLSGEEFDYMNPTTEEAILVEVLFIV